MTYRFAVALSLVTLTLPVLAQTGQAPTIFSREDVAGIPQLRNRITISLVGVPIETALREIARKAGLLITYNDRILPAERRIWLTREEIRTDAALEEVLRGSGLRLVALTSGQVVVIKAGEPELQGSGIQTDTIRGRVTTDSGRAIAGADVIVTMAPNREVFRTTSDSSGQYSLVIQNGTGDYLVYLGAVGRQPIRRRITQTGPRQALVVDAALGSAITQLATVQARAPRPRPRRNDDASLDVGGTSTQFVSVPGALSPDEMGDPTAMLLTIPGTALTPDGGVSAFGLSSETNRTTLGGMSFDGTLPRDMPVRSRAGPTFDPTRGGFAGLSMAMEFLPGSLLGLRWGHVTLDAPQLQSGDRISRALGQRYANASVSLGASGELIPDLLVYSSSFQLRRRTSDLTSILTGDSGVFDRLGVARDSIDRFLSLAASSGVPLSVAGIPGSRTSTEFSTAFRLDKGVATPILGLVDDQRSILTLSGVARYARDEPLGISALASPAYGGEQTNRSVLLQLGYSRYLDAGSAYLSETKTGFSINRAESEPYLRVPDARVRVSSVDPSGVNGIASLSFGGNGAIQSSATIWRWESTSEIAFTPANHITHRLKFFAESQLEGQTRTGLGATLGAFSYNSLADLQANRPSSFTRTLQSPSREGTQWTGALAVADFWTPKNNLFFVFGPRLEYNTFIDKPSPNPAIASTFGVPNNAAPRGWHLSPRFGFTWIYPGLIRAGGRGGFGSSGIGSMIATPRGVLRGGIGEFRSRLPAMLLADARLATGLPGSTIERVTCVGDAVPTPDWPGYATNPLLIPSSCADGSPGAFTDVAPTVRMVDPSYDATRNWQANLSWGSAWKHLTYTIDAMYVLNLGLPGTRDLNFGGTERFSLAGEGGRPVFVNASSIVPTTGLTLAIDSRRSPAFGRVIDQISDLKANVKRLTVFLQPYTPTSLSRWQVRGWYTFQDEKSQARGFDGFTSGDPRIVEWRTGSSPRHMFGSMLGYRLRRPSIIATLGTHIQSGFPFTPMVAGDINGDGLTNDRAFVYSSGDAPPEIGAAMSDLYATVPGSVSDCLRRQMGRIAATNSCRGPWNIRMNARVDWQRNFFAAGFSRYVRVSLNLNNPLAGLDQLFHGSSNLHGWGSPGSPDPRLYHVRGFDPTSRRYLYEVNPRFGNYRPAFTAFANPFRITLDLSFSINGDLAQKMANTFIRSRRNDPPGRPSADTIYRRLTSDGTSPYSPIANVIALSDSLLLTPDQVSVLRAAQLRHMVAFDSTMRSLAFEMSNLPDPVDLKALAARIRVVRGAAFSAASLYLILRDVLTPLQITLLPADMQRSIRGG